MFYTAPKSLYQTYIYTYMSVLMMNRDDRKRRFNEAIVKTLYPPPSPQDLEPEIQLDPYSHVISDACENASTSTEEDEHQERDSETEKLTRAQRKRLRKKKMKEESVLRGNLIGPLMLPTQATQCGDDAPPPVRSNASEEGDEKTCANSKKMKQRRMAKRVAKEKRDAPALDKCSQSAISSDAVDDLKEAHK